MPMVIRSGLTPMVHPIRMGNTVSSPICKARPRIDGAEFYLDIHPVSWLHFENALTLTYGTNRSDKGHAPDSLKYLPFIPPPHTHSELRGTYAKGFGRWKNAYAFVGFDHYNAQNRFFSAYGTETYTPGYNLLGAGVGVNLVNAAGKKLVELFVEGTNLANVNYQSNMSRLKYFDNPVVPAGVRPGIFNMGRNVSFSSLSPLIFRQRQRAPDRNAFPHPAQTGLLKDFHCPAETTST